MADYVIIGGGSSGGVIASRLSEDPDVTVCLLEAGGPGTSPLVSTPGAFAALIQDYRINTLNWRFNTDPSKALNDRRLYNPRGKMLGGSSGMNGMVYIRGDRSDSTTGPNSATTAGVTTMSCPISARLRIMSAVRMSFTARRDRFTYPTASANSMSMMLSSRRRLDWTIKPIRTSMVPARKVSASISLP